MSYDNWLTTPPPMESAPEPEEDGEPEDNTGPSDDGSDDLAEYRACPYCGEDDQMRCSCDGLGF